MQLLGWLGATSGIIGAATGISGLCLSIWTFRRDRPQLAAKLQHGYKVNENVGDYRTDYTYTMITVTNRGRRPTAIGKMWFTQRDSSQSLLVIDAFRAGTTDPKVTMEDLVKCALRLRPDRIVVGEVRGGEALALLKAWNTGHPGGLATLHANSAEDALSRLEDLVGEVSQHISRRAIARTIQLIIFVRRTHQGRRVESLSRVTGFDGNKYLIEPIINCD